MGLNGGDVPPLLAKIHSMVPLLLLTAEATPSPTWQYHGN